MATAVNPSDDFRRAARWIIASALLATLAACGQKGPLYLPDQGGEVVTRPGGPMQQPPPPQSPEAGPQPSTEPEPNPTDAEKKPR